MSRLRTGAGKFCLARSHVGRSVLGDNAASFGLACRSRRKSSCDGCQSMTSVELSLPRSAAWRGDSESVEGAPLPLAELPSIRQREQARTVRAQPTYYVGC